MTIMLWEDQFCLEIRSKLHIYCEAYKLVVKEGSKIEWTLSYSSSFILIDISEINGWNVLLYLLF